jgi:phosphodiesterase/alkaline phosphatase D-like protein
MRRVGLARPTLLALLGSALLATAGCGNTWATRDVPANGRITSQSAARAEPRPVDWVWSGALRPDGATVKARIAATNPENVELVIAATPSLEGGRRVAARIAASDPSVVTFVVDGLAPGREHFYAVEAAGRLASELAGSFVTPLEGAHSFTVALGACARTGSSHPVFDEIREHRPLFFLHLGDFHYENISSLDPGDYRRAYDRVLASPRQSALYRSTPIVYMWDDHDYAGNDSDGTAVGRPAARAVYRERVPHYPLAAADGDQPIYHSFVVGRVLFVVTDTRSARSPHRLADGPRKTMLGARQKSWLLERLGEAPRHGVVVWVNTLPWIAQRHGRADHWGGYASERREIAEFVVARGIRNLVMVSGDAHMLAIDDGTNNRYGSGEGVRFPVLHAAALDRDGSEKGGPYSEGAFPGGGQYALMSIEDDGGDRIRVSWSGRRVGGGELVALDIEVTVPPAAFVQ